MCLMIHVTGRFMRSSSAMRRGPSPQRAILMSTRRPTWRDSSGAAGNQQTDQVVHPCEIRDRDEALSRLSGTASCDDERVRQPRLIHVVVLSIFQVRQG